MRDQLRAWVTIGTQSLGGGASTLYLMRTVMVLRRRWLTAHEFLQDWTLSRLSPGNHLTALAMLIGRRIGGRRGVAVAASGLLVPSGIITAVMAAGYGLIRNEPAVQSALAGVAPVTIGMMIGITAVMVRTAIRRDLPSAAIDLLVIAAAVVAGFLVPGATIVIIVAGAFVGVLALGRHEPPPDTTDG